MKELGREKEERKEKWRGKERENAQKREGRSISFKLYVFRKN